MLGRQRNITTIPQFRSLSRKEALSGVMDKGRVAHIAGLSCEVEFFSLRQSTHYPRPKGSVTDDVGSRAV